MMENDNKKMSWLDELRIRRKWFDAYLDPDGTGKPSRSICGASYTCPCCGYPTLDERGGYDICSLCFWEDDGQDDDSADEVWGGPNGDYSLAKARENFANYLVMYEPEKDTRIGGPDNQTQLNAKQSIIRAFDNMRESGNPERDSLCKIVEDGFKAL